jgi:hypothetical protein
LEPITSRRGIWRFACTPNGSSESLHKHNCVWRMESGIKGYNVVWSTLFQHAEIKCGGWLVNSSCCHLEHRASVKRFVSLQFLNLRQSVGLLGRVISPSQRRYMTQTQNKLK